jgi:hypothetical protein
VNCHLDNRKKPVKLLLAPPKRARNLRESNMLRKSGIFAVAAISLVTILGTPTAATAQIAGGVVAHVLLGELENKTNNVIDHARDAGDALIWNAGKQALAVIEAWKKSNSELLDKTFADLDKASRDLFQNIDDTMNRISTERELAVQDAQRLTVEWAQLLKSVPGINKDAELWYYTPRVIVPIGKDKLKEDVVLRLIGPKLSQSKPEIKTPEDRPLTVNIATEGEIDALIKRQDLQFDQSASKFVTYKFNFIQTEGILKDKAATRDLTVWLPPVIMAHYKITPHVKQVTYERQEYPTDVGGKGKDSPYPITIGVRPDLAATGWKIDVERVIKPRAGWYADLGGDHADCAGLYNSQASEDSFVFNVQLGHKTDNWGHKSDAWKNCRVFVPVRRAITATVDAPALEDDLNWSDDKRREIPADVLAVMVGKTIEVSLFNGRTHIIDAHNRSPLGLLTVEDNGSSVSFKPNPPSQF